ncbi:MAG: DUF3040 domain-containing protein [Antricoccus sp.]
MPLSEHEQRVLDEIAQSLAAEDPKFRAAGKAGSGKAFTARRIRFGVALVIVGLAVLVGGVWLNSIPVGVLGFLIMFGGGVLGVMASQAPQLSSAADAKGKQSQSSSQTKNKFEDRLRRRFDQ